LLNRCRKNHHRRNHKWHKEPDRNGVFKKPGKGQRKKRKEVRSQPKREEKKKGGRRAEKAGISVKKGIKEKRREGEKVSVGGMDTPKCASFMLN